MENYIHKVSYYETDKMGITHHSNYIRWMEEARVDFLEQIGFGYDKLEKEGIISPVISVECEYKTPTTFGDSVEISVEVEEFKGVRLIIKYIMKNVETKEVVLEGRTKHCFVNQNNKPVILKKDFPDFDKKLKELAESFLEQEKIEKDVEFNSLIPELSVSNIEKSKKFYENLGFKVIYERREDKFCLIQMEQNQIMLEEINGNWNVGELKYPYGNGINISMSVSKVEELYKFLKNNNISFFVDLKTSEYKVKDKIYKDKEFLLQDPDGYLLRFND